MTESSPDGKWNAVCRDWNVVLENKETKETRQITTEGHRKFRYGTANWVYGEEINVRHAMWWTPDSSKLIFYEFDETLVEDFYLTTNLTGYNTKLDVEGYMKAGAPNPKVSLLIYDLASKKIKPVDTGDDDQYIFNVRFTPDGSELLYNCSDRRQKSVKVVALNYKTAKTRLVVKEAQDTWQDNSPLMRYLKDGERFIWLTEKTGWKHYELRHLDASFICPLTKGEYPVIGILQVDEDKGYLYYSARSDKHPLCDQFHRVRLDGSDNTRMTSLSLNHSGFNLSPDHKWFTAQHENIETPASTAIYSTTGELVHILAKGDEPKIKHVELFTFKAEDNVTDLYGVLYKPKNFDPNKKYPLVVSVYGGPGSRAVYNRYSSSSRYLRDEYLVARIDNRGTSGRGKRFKGSVYGKLGDVDIKDQADGVRYLRQRPYIDGDRVGIYGHSYGGFMAAIGLLKHPDVFCAASAGAAVTDWRHYDTIYTERYMNLPQDNPEGYKNGACTTYVKQLKGHLLIMHGMLDNNVHPNNAWRLIEALDKADKKYESRFFPKAGHGGASSKTMWDFFYRRLIAPYEDR